MEVQPVVLIIMGVAGVGKSTIGRALAATLGWAFYDGDDFHPPANVAKMAAGHPLNDADRRPWLDALHDLAHRCLAKGRPAVIAASLLKERYRQRVLAGNSRTAIVYLQADFETLEVRLQQRPAHFMKAEMLNSQLADLEPPLPGQALWADATQSVPKIVRQICTGFDLQSARH